MNPNYLVESLLNEDEGAYLDLEGLKQAYLTDYEGDPGFRKSVYAGKSSDGKSHRYIVLGYDDVNDVWLVFNAYVTKNKDGVLALDFGGSADDFGDEETALKAFNDQVKKSHMVDGDKVKKQPPTSRKFPEPYHARSSWHRLPYPDNPHWDGNRYAL